MNWKRYGECRGKPACSEVVIRCDPADVDHPWVRKRKAMYEAMDRRVLVAAGPAKRGNRPRPDAPATRRPPLERAGMRAAPSTS